MLDALYPWANFHALEEEMSEDKSETLGTCQFGLYCTRPHRRGQNCQNWASLPSPEGTTKDLRKMDTPESRKHWEFVDGVSKRVDNWPQWKQRAVSSEGTVKSEQLGPAPDSLKDPAGLIEWHLRKHEGVELTDGTRNVIKNMLLSVVEQERIRQHCVLSSAQE